MMFRNYCYEKWQQYQEETCVFMRQRGYNHECLDWKDYIKKYKWWLRRMYKMEYNTLTPKWESNCNERILSSQ